MKKYKYEDVLEMAVFEVLTSKAKEKNLSNEKLQELNHNDIETLLYNINENEKAYRLYVYKKTRYMIEKLTQDGLYDELSTPKVKSIPLDENLDNNDEVKLY